jgi:hypothetical protein
LSWFKRILIALAAIVGLILLAIVGVVIAVVIYDFYVRTQVAQFYKTHPMLRSMIETQPVATSGVDPWPQMRTVLLEHVPVGSSRSEAVRILGAEGMVCTAINTPTQNRFACSVPDEPVGVPRWHVEVQFDEHDRVANGRVLPLKGKL